MHDAHFLEIAFYAVCALAALLLIGLAYVAYLAIDHWMK